MARPTWHPYAPDQAFGHEAAQDEELLDRALARLEQGRQRAPRAGGKAEPSGESIPRRMAAGMQLPGWVEAGAGLPVTTNIALDAAARVRSEAD
jgi:hypothetical protein